jgi:hypothetical protein
MKERLQCSELFHMICYGCTQDTFFTFSLQFDCLLNLYVICRVGDFKQWPSTTLVNFLSEHL